MIKEMHSYLETLGCLDERTKLSLADNVKSMLFRNTNPKSEGITISSVASKLGLRLSLDQLQKVAKEIAKRYKMKNGVGPAKHSQYVDGAVREVNSYTMKDVDLIRDVLEGENKHVPNQIKNSIIYPRFKIHPIAKDRNCLFAAINYWCQKSKEEVRHSIVNFMEKNEQFRTTLQGEVEGVTTEQYFTSMRQNGCFGGENEIAAASELFKRSHYDVLIPE